MNNQTTEAQEEKAGAEARSKGVLRWLDAIAKLAGAGAVVWVAYTANVFQSRVTSLNLQSNREAAESDLRATMFSNLIGPLVGPDKENGLNPFNESLLTQLLALNFHQSFEIKPLMEDAYRRLEGERSGKDGALAVRAQGELRSIARRVADRQFAAIGYKRNVENGACREHILDLVIGGSQEESAEDFDCYHKRWFQKSGDPNSISDIPQPIDMDSFTVIPDSEEAQLVIVSSPDRKYTLTVAPVWIDWHRQTIRLEVAVGGKSSASSSNRDPLPAYAFTLTWFDLPLTDNTLLSDGNRFAITLKAVQTDKQKEQKSMQLRIDWFPKEYITPRERPLNYKEMKELLSGVG